jgi:hypothetical protein
MAFDRDSILSTLVIFGIIFGVIFVVSFSAQHMWIFFWEYGDQYNENTMPPLIWWEIAFRVSPLSFWIALIGSGVTMIVGWIISRN